MVTDARVVPAIALQFVQLETLMYTMPGVELPLRVPEMLKEGIADEATKFCVVVLPTVGTDGVAGV